MLQPNDFTESPEFYNLLDEESMKLRSVAGDFEKYCLNHQADLPQLNQLAKAFHSLKTIDIKKIDNALNQIKTAFYAVTAKISETGTQKLLSNDSNLEIMNLRTKFLDEINDFVKTADEIAKRGK